MITRRHFLGDLGLAGSLAIAPGLKAREAATSATAPAISVFTKPLQSFSFEQLGVEVAKMGFAGIELPVRKKGHIDPAAAEEELPKAVAAFEKAGVELTILTSDIRHPDDPHAAKLLRTAKRLGIKAYRAGWFRYRTGIPVRKQIADYTPRVRELAAFNKELGIQGLLQNHSGAKYVGSAIWDYAILLEDVDPDALGVAFDLAHATVEGGKTWPNHVDIIWPHVRALYAKDFAWKGKKTEWLPFGRGNVDTSFYRRLRSMPFDGPISLHVEYERGADPQRFVKLMKRDLAALRAALALR